MQAEIPTIVDDKAGNGSTYASLETIVDITRPILNKHGFSVTFETKSIIKDEPAKNKKDEYIFFGYAVIVAVLRHRLGFSIKTETTVPFDFSGTKVSNTAQAQGSAISYGKRYAYCSLLNITTRSQDDDAKSCQSAQVKITTLQQQQLQQAYDSLTPDMQTEIDGNLLQSFGSTDFANVPRGLYQNVLADIQAKRRVSHENT